MLFRVKGRLAVAIISTTIEEAVLAVIVLAGLPQAGINIPLYVLVIMMLGWLLIAVFTYRAGSRALKKKPVVFGAMIGSRGRVVEALRPSGMIKVGGELWRAEAISGEAGAGDEVMVVGRQGSKLLVRVADKR